MTLRGRDRDANTRQHNDRAPRRERGILMEVDGDQPPDSISAEIQAHLPAGH